jgi:chromosome segregation ATPase
MKTLSKLSMLLVIFITSGLVLSSCNFENNKGRAATELEEERAEERDELIARYENLINEIDAQIAEIDRRMEGADEETRRRLEEAREELLDERSELEKAMDELGGASNETWDEVSAFAEETYVSARDGLQRTIQDIEEWFE